MPKGISWFNSNIWQFRKIHAWHEYPICRLNEKGPFRPFFSPEGDFRLVVLPAAQNVEQVEQLRFGAGGGFGLAGGAQALASPLAGAGQQQGAAG